MLHLDSTGVEQSSNNPKNQGSNPSISAGGENDNFLSIYKMKLQPQCPLKCKNLVRLREENFF